MKSGDTATTINNALASGLNLLFTPGVYHLSAPLNITTDRLNWKNQRIGTHTGWMS